jgi:uncharacterized protein (TIGR03435 family)
MLQSRWTERFHPVFRRKKKDMPIHAFVIGKNGSKLKESTEDSGVPDASLPGVPPSIRTDSAAPMVPQRCLNRNTSQQLADNLITLPALRRNPRRFE